MRRGDGGRGWFRRWWERAFNPLHGREDALAFVLEENPRPRDTGTLWIGCCGRRVAVLEELALVQADPQAVIALIHRHGGELRACPGSELVFVNFSPWLEGVVREELVRLKIGPQSGRVK